MTTSGQMHTNKNTNLELEKSKKEVLPKSQLKEFQIPKAKQKKVKSVHLNDENNHEGQDSHSDDDIKKNHKDSHDSHNRIYMKNSHSQKIFLKKKDVQMKEDAPFTENDIFDQEEYLKHHPNDYNCLIKLIEIYKAFNMKKKLKEIRLYMLKLYPLSEEMWLDWISDEFQEIPKEDFHEIFIFKEFYEKSISDFYYLRICKKYLKYLMTLLNEVEMNKLEEQYNFTYKNLRAIFEEILEIWGLDFNNSSKIWELYLKFENQNLKKFLELKNEVEYANTISLIRSIYRRRLSFPHVDLDLVWNEYLKFELNDEEKKKEEMLYLKSSQKVSHFINFEEKFGDLLNLSIKENNSDKLRKFLEKDLIELTENNFSYIILYYEKALQYNPDDENLWSNFLDHIQNTSSSISNRRHLKILKRACKCCYFKVNFWILLLREMEKQNIPRVEIEKKINEAYQCSENERSKYEIWKYSLEYYCRNYRGDLERLHLIRKDFEKCISQGFQNNEYTIKIYMIWAEFETYKVKDMIKMVEIMETVVCLSNTDHNHWNAYIQYQKFFGVISEIRTVYKRALQNSSTDKMLISLHWIAWEKIFGTPMDIENAILFSKRILKLNQNSGSNLNHTNNSKANSNTNFSFNNNTSFFQKNIRARDKNNSTSKENEVNSNCLNSDFESMEESSESEIDNNNPIIVENDYLKKEETKLVQATLIQTRILSNNPSNIIFDPFQIKPEGINVMGIDSKSREFSNKFYKMLDLEDKSIKIKKKNSIVVGNLPFYVNNLQIFDVFKKCGEIKEIKIFKEINGKCNSYIEFHNSNSVELAMNLCISLDQNILQISKVDNERFIAYIYNFNKKVHDKEFMQFFFDNNLKYKEIVFNSKNNNDKYKAVVEFFSKEDLDKAISLNKKMIKNKFFSIKKKKESRSDGFTELSLKEDLSLLNKKRDSSHSYNDWSGETNINTNEKNCSSHV